LISHRDCIVFLLAKAHQRAQGVFKENLQAHGLTPVQCLILRVLLREDG
jgi:DNA-binding MarR family transcriptional regulator